MNSMRPQHVVVVGGGASGTLTALALLTRTEHRVTVVDSTERLGLGVAYGDCESSHVLNSHANSMSCDPNHPADYVDWLQQHQPGATGMSFGSRSEYGQYLRQRFAERSMHHEGRCEHVRQDVVRITANREVTLQDGFTIQADHVVLCVGLNAVTWPMELADQLRDFPGAYENPWLPWVFDKVAPDVPVLVLGTGLTAVDVALSLNDRPRTAEVVCVSRHGELPRVHRNEQHLPAKPPAWWHPQPGTSLRILEEDMRRAADECRDWRTIVDAMQPHADDIWRNLSPADKAEFIATKARTWENLRHRMCSDVANRFMRLVSEGTVRVVGGGIHSLDVAGDTVTAVIGDARETLTCGAVVNCTGPGSTPENSPQIIRTMIDDQVAAADKYGFGISTDVDGTLLRPDGTRHDGIWTIGPLRRGTLWETTAIPDLRAQAYATAAAIGATDPR